MTGIAVATVGALSAPRSRGRGRLLAIFLVLLPWPALAQSPLEDRLRNRIETAFVANGMEVMDERVHARNTLQRAYTARDFHPYWVADDGLTASGRNLVAWLETEPQKHGLRPADYHLQPVSELEAEDRAAALVDLELALSDAFLMLGSHFLAGRLNPETLDPEWHATRRHRDLLPVIDRAATLAEPGEALAALLPRGAGYARLVQQLAELRQIRAAGGWPAIDGGPLLEEGDAGARVEQVGRRLGLRDDEASPERFTAALGAAVRRFQVRHGLNPDGVIGPATLKALNVPVRSRIDQVIVNLERWRWLPEDLGSRYIIVNIAGFRLDVVIDGEVPLSMRVVVGQPYRRTPVFSGTMTYLVLNPSWEVPPRIAIRDKLPAIKSDPDYLARQGYAVLQGWGADERRIDPATVDWATLGPGNFRYRLRQAPGPLNALGRVKFMFPNQHAVYLHDTPSRELFAKEQRSFSSGCIRLEQPLALAELLLTGADNWRRGDIDRALASGRETVVSLPRTIAVHLLYWTAWVDGDTVQFRDDIYGRDVRVLDELREPPPELDGA